MDVDLGEAYVIGNVIEGCTDPQADNYDANAMLDDGSCEYSGCTDPNAQNYDPNATIDDDSCEFPPLGELSFENFNHINIIFTIFMYLD